MDVGCVGGGGVDVGDDGGSTGQWSGLRSRRPRTQGGPSVAETRYDKPVSRISKMVPF